MQEKEKRKLKIQPEKVKKQEKQEYPQERN